MLKTGEEHLESLRDGRIVDIRRERFEARFGTPFTAPIERWKLMKLAWDLIGSEFAGRHALYEKFYAGHSVIVRDQSFREAPWDDFHAIVDDALAAIEVPGAET